MAIRKVIETKSGHEVSYWKIVDYNPHMSSYRCDITLMPYKDKKTRDKKREQERRNSKKKAIEPMVDEKRIIRIYDRPTPLDVDGKPITYYTDYLSVSAMSGKYKDKNIVEILYQFILENEEEFEDAWICQDCALCSHAGECPECGVVGD